MSYQNAFIASVVIVSATMHVQPVELMLLVHEICVRTRTLYVQSEIVICYLNVMFNQSCILPVQEHTIEFILADENGASSD